MTDRGRLPEVPPSALRDAATDDQIDRLWRRVSNDIGVPGPRELRAATAWTWAPAAFIIVFVSGVFVGARWARTDHATDPRLAPEPVPVPAGPTANRQVSPSPAEQRTQPKRPKRRKQLLRRSPVPLPELPSDRVEHDTPTPEPITQEPPRWQLLSDEGEYEQARQAVDQQGGFDAVIAEATPEQLMSLVDIARFSRQHPRAVQALRMVVDKYPADPNAPLAAWQLGIMLSRTGDLDGAARAFAAYRALSPDGDFSEDALARQVEAALEQGEFETARQLAEQYAREFPKGERIDEFREALGHSAAGTSTVVPPAEPAPPNGGTGTATEDAGAAPAAGPGL